jgi:uncharacterized repeat protein (TIGR03803 family)
MVGNRVLYGTTPNGGASNAGAVYALTPPVSPGSSWTESVLYSFAGGSDGMAPAATVNIGLGGVLYGTTFQGGTGSCFNGCGTVFSLTPPATQGGTWTETVLYRFTGGSDGAGPQTGVVIGAGQVLYGTTVGTSNGATVFALSPPSSPGGAWSEQTLYQFPPDLVLNGGVAVGARGVVYGAVADTLFALIPPASSGAPWTYQVLCTGFQAEGRVAIGSGGVLYGASEAGGAFNSGQVFSIAPPSVAGGACTETVVHDFSPGSGYEPVGGVVMDSGGNLYGATSIGQLHQTFGSIYIVVPPGLPGGSWIYGTLHVFQGKSDGGNPRSAPVVGNGVLYGTTSNGGTFGAGTVYSWVP